MPTRGHPLLALAAAIGPMMADDPERLAAVVAENADHPDPWVGAMLHLMRGMSAENAGAAPRYGTTWSGPAAAFAGLGDRWGLSACLNGLAALAITEGDDQTALKLQNEALDLIREINAFTDAAQIQIGRAHLLNRLGRHEAALELLEEVLEAARRSGSTMSGFLALVGLLEHHRQRGEPEQAWSTCARRDRGGRRVARAAAAAGDPRGLRAMLYMDDGDLDAARAGAAPRAAVRPRSPATCRSSPRSRSATARYARLDRRRRTAVRVLGIAEEMLGAADRSEPDASALVDELAAEPGYACCYAAGKTGCAGRTSFSSRTPSGCAADDLRPAGRCVTPCGRRPAAPAA